MAALLTFEALPASLLVEVLLAAVIGNMAVVVVYSPKWRDVESPDQVHGGLVEILVRGVVYSPVGLGLAETGCGVLGHPSLWEQLPLQGAVDDEGCGWQRCTWTGKVSRRMERSGRSRLRVKKRLN